jgi:uncharacterized damage-inducible protein DinB
MEGTMREYRNGAVGALADEYQRAVDDLLGILNRLSEEEYGVIRDRDTADDACRSIQTIVSHVVGAGYGYAGMLRRAWGVETPERARTQIELANAREAFGAMLTFTWETLDGRWQFSEEDSMSLQIRSGWGQVYDFEQLFEHAIVHVLRHRRQIERFLQR